MRLFNQPQIVKTSPEAITRARNFTDQVIGTVDYTDSRQSNKIKVWQDHFISKIGEEAVCQVFRQFITNVTEPDYTIYIGRNKSWDADLKINGNDLAVKTQSKSSAKRYGLSWTFQSGSYRRDIILDEPDAWVCFVQCDDTEPSYGCIVYPPRQIKEITFGQPKLEKLIGQKLVVYAKANGIEP